jgi:hypothetical protein
MSDSDKRPLRHSRSIRQDHTVPEFLQKVVPDVLLRRFVIVMATKSARGLLQTTRQQNGKEQG